MPPRVPAKLRARMLTTCQRTLKFINDEASSIHGNMRVGSIYTSESGEWKIGGFEVLSNVKDDDAIIYVCGLKGPSYATRTDLYYHRPMEVWYPTRRGTHLRSCNQAGTP